MDNVINENTEGQVVDSMLEAIFSSDKGSEDSISTEVAWDCTNPHWSISRDDLKRILHIVLSFPSKSTIFTTIWRDADVIRFRADNRDAYLDASLPLQNVGTAWDTKKVYLVDSVKLIAFLSSYAQFVLSFDEDGTIFYESPYARYKLDVVNAHPSVFPGLPSSVVKWVKFPISNSELAVFKSLYGFAVKLSDSKILIDSDKADAFYTLYKFTAFHKSEVNENVVIRRLDLPSLKEIVNDSTLFAYTKERLFFKFDLGFVSFVRVPYDEESFMYPETFLTGASQGTFVLDVPIVKRAIKLSSLFSITEFVFSPDGSDIYMHVSDKARFKVGSFSSIGMPLSASFTVGVEIFSNLLSTVLGSSLEVLVSEHGVQLNTSSGVYSLSRMSMGQIKQGNVPLALSHPSLSNKPSLSERVTNASGVMPYPKQEIALSDFQDSEVI